jgi:hypothetical protein
MWVRTPRPHDGIDYRLNSARERYIRRIRVHLILVYIGLLEPSLCMR